MNYAKFFAVMAGSIALKQVLCTRSSLRENKPAFTSHFNAFFTVPTSQLEDKVLNRKNPF